MKDKIAMHPRETTTAKTIMVTDNEAFFESIEDGSTVASALEGIDTGGLNSELYYQTSTSCPLIPERNGKTLTEGRQTQSNLVHRLDEKGQFARVPA